MLQPSEPTGQGYADFLTPYLVLIILKYLYKWNYTLCSFLCLASPFNITFEIIHVIKYTCSLLSLLYSVILYEYATIYIFVLMLMGIRALLPPVFGCYEEWSEYSCMYLLMTTSMHFCWIYTYITAELC